jgi:hypothetical protein
MKLGTVVYENKIYNLDYMTVDEMKNLLEKIEKDKSNNFEQGEKVIKR